jgi:hypothetical protein
MGKPNPCVNGIMPARLRSLGDVAANNPDRLADEFLADPTISAPASQAGPTLPMGLMVPEAALAAYQAAIDGLHHWLRRLVRDLERVNGPVTAQILANDLKAKLVEADKGPSVWLAAN